ncbi:hypothetical protein CAPTEDRAFT_175243 [Capitella teleta]|uniref:Mitochondrial import receptor subunit TOM22 homolog n=1 Tax=Capitella teleta TaxID=283909 RepID=R7VHF2_CAPTE|nr:hypothetical protein CAPTEDRAFT_175243 [Capitella teleta]|eukprot:ELU15706.1 hypothetical protein CAPTEDRAFT_175243 [Capitella teleta]
MSGSDGPRLIDLSTGEEIERVSNPASIMPSITADDADEFDDEDETIGERLWGLTEMFPESVRSLSSSATSMSISGSKWMYQTTRSLMWVLASSATILALPVMFESERAQMEEQQLQQQRQIMLGPNAALSGQQGMMAGPGGMPAMPSVAPPQR